MWILFHLTATKACHLKKENGGCTGTFLRYYYDSVHDKCKKFIWTGCRGNGNRFFDYNSCNATCAGVHGEFTFLMFHKVLWNPKVRLISCTTTERKLKGCTLKESLWFSFTVDGEEMEEDEPDTPIGKWEIIDNLIPTLEHFCIKRIFLPIASFIFAFTRLVVPALTFYTH